MTSKCERLFKTQVDTLEVTGILYSFAPHPLSANILIGIHFEAITANVFVKKKK
jgi:hypothetical protein